MSAKRSVARRAPADAARADWCSEVSVLLVVAGAEHAADCGDPDCVRCEAFRERLEEPDLMHITEAARELNRVLAVEVAAVSFIAALDDKTEHRGRLASEAANRLRTAVESRSYSDLMMSRYTRDERRAIAREALQLDSKQKADLAKKHGVTLHSVNGWIRDLRKAGLDVVEMPTVAPKVSGDTGAEVATLRAEIRRLEEQVRLRESAIVDLVTRDLAARRNTGEVAV